ICGVAEHRYDKITAANVVSQICEEMRTQRVVTHVLDDASAVCVRMRFLQIFCRSSRESPQEKRLNRDFPDGVDDRFMRENGVSVQVGSQKAKDCKESNQIPHSNMVPRANSGTHSKFRPLRLNSCPAGTKIPNTQSQNFKGQNVIRPILRKDRIK